MTEHAIENDGPPAQRGSRAGRVAKWGFGIVGALVLLVIAALAILNTPIGERFLVDRLAQQTFANGLNVKIGRIDGDIYSEAVLHDVRLSDPKGVFLTIPRAEIDWNPSGWFSNRLDIDSLAMRRATLTRIPEFIPSEEEGPILPGFDISIDRLEVDNLTLASGIAGETAQRVDLVAEVQTKDQRLFVQADAKLGMRDTFALLLHATPDENTFAISGNLSATKDGVIANLLGLDAPYTARVHGNGSWEAWKGWALVRSDGERVAALRLINRSGTFELLGELDPGNFVTGTVANALGSDVAVKSQFAFEDRTFVGSAALLGRGVYITGNGLVDLARNQVKDLELTAKLRDPALFGPNLKLEDASATAVLNGAFSDLNIAHELNIGRLVSGETRLAGLTQQGVAHYSGSQWTLPLNVTVDRISTGNALVDPRLVKGTLRGQIRLAENQLLADNLRVAFPGLAANLALRGDLAASRYQIRGPVRVNGLALDNVGRAGGTAMIDFDLRPNGWKVNADLAARIAPVTNESLANLAGQTIKVRGGITTGSDRALTFNRMRVDSEKLKMVLDGSVNGGATQLAGSGTHTDYGDFTVEARITDDGPAAQLVFAQPFSGLNDVSIAIVPTENGFEIETRGGSALGAFDGAVALSVPNDGPTRIDIERMTVFNTAVTGGLTLADGGVQGVLNLSGGGLDGTVALAPHPEGQGVKLDIKARNARFGGETPLIIKRADIDAQGVIGEGLTNFSGNVNAQGLQYGDLFIGRLAAQGQIENGVGSIDASITGRRGTRFALDINGQFQSDRITFATRGNFAGQPITMPRRAVLTALESGGWQLAPTQISYGDGGLIASGQFGDEGMALELKLARMPLSLIDLVAADMGIGGTISGVVDFSSLADNPPTGLAKVKINDLTRSGLILSSKPVDLALVARLEPDQLEMRAVLENEDIRRGRMQVLINDLPATGDLTQRLRAGRLDAQLRYQGAAESLWRLAAIDAFDLTGPVAMAVNATGTLAEPRVRGTVSSDDLRVRSALSGTDIQDMSMRGTFVGSRLRLTSFSGTAPNGGRVSGSGIIDLEGLGERVEGRFVEVRGPTLDLRVAAKNALLLDANGLSATISGPLRIVSDGLGGTIAGRVRVDRASWRLGTTAEDMRLPQISTREINAPADRAPAASASRPWRYLINAKTPSRIDVDGMGLESEWGADIILRGTTADPRIGGTATVVRGDYTFAGKRFELTKGEIDFDVSQPINPTLDIKAETDADDVNVIVNITGNALQPEITFNSDPALPEEEILARLLFGGSITTLSATDALQLGAAVASLRGGGGMDPINQLRSAIGLDRLRIVSADPALGHGTGVAIGKNIGRRFYAEIITDGRGYSATEVEFRVTSWLSLLGTVSTLGRESVVAEVSRDY